MAERKAFVVANLVTYYKMREQGREPRAFRRGELEKKRNSSSKAGLRSASRFASAPGVPVGYGLRSARKLQVYQSEEFLYSRAARVARPLEINPAGNAGPARRWCARKAKARRDRARRLLPT